MYLRTLKASEGEERDLRKKIYHITPESSWEAVSVGIVV